MNHSKPFRILAIDPGTRYTGIAVLENGDLVYHGVTSFRRFRSAHEFLTDARKLMTTLLGDFKPVTFVIEKAFFAQSRRVALLNVYVDELRRMAKEERLDVVGLAPSTMKLRLCGNGHATKEEVARAVVAAYPELRVFLTQDRKWKARYHSNMFDAVALGMVVWWDRARTLTMHSQVVVSASHATDAKKATSKQ